MHYERLRQQQVSRTRLRIERDSYPRVQMFFLVTLTGAAGFLASFGLFVVYSAPLLFAELLVDGVLAATLYRRLRGIEPRHWLETAVRRTFLPFLLTACFTGAAGWTMAMYAPGANSIGKVFLHAKQGR